MARYNFERLCNKMQKVKRLNNFRRPIEEAYFPKLGKAWADRAKNLFLHDLNWNNMTEQVNVDISDLERWSDRIIDACHQGFYLDVNHLKLIKKKHETNFDILIQESGKPVKFNDDENDSERLNDTGIDIMGNLVESS